MNFHNEHKKLKNRSTIHCKVKLIMKMGDLIVQNSPILNNFIVIFTATSLVSVSDCSHPRPLGMENGYIKDRQLTASSHTFSSPCCSAARARPEIEVIVLRDSWLAGAQDTEPWLRVNFIANTSVSGIMTQGSRHLDAWVINYTLSYSTDGEIFQDYLENNETKVKSQQTIKIWSNKDVN